MSDTDYPRVRPSIPRRSAQPFVTLFGLALLVIVMIGGFYWFIVRVDVGSDEILVLVNKTGKTLPAELRDQYGDQVVLYPELVKAIAAHTSESEENVRTGYKGIRYETLGPGRHWPNPYYVKRIKFPMPIISPGEVGVKIRKYGQPLPPGQTVATSTNNRGAASGYLVKGRYAEINPLAYEVQRFTPIEVPEGHVGVVTLLAGTQPEESNTYTVMPGEKGVQTQTLPPGTYPYNPYEEKIDVVDLRSQKYDMLGQDAIHFPSGDSFTITMEGTIEWAIGADRVAEVTVAYGDESDILSKIILPNARSIARIQGSKLKARDFISGKTRKAFQERLLHQLQADCLQQGIVIKQALVREIQPPAEIASLISQREQAEQDIERSTNQMEEAKAQALLIEQEEKQQQNREIGEARRNVVTVVKEAERAKDVAVLEASRDLEVAKLDLQSAEKEAAAIQSRGQAEANVVLYNYQARAEPLKSAVGAFGDGHTYAQQFFLQKIGPSIKSILSNTEGPFADIFKQFQSFEAASGQGGSN